VSPGERLLKLCAEAYGLPDDDPEKPVRLEIFVAACEESAGNGDFDGHWPWEALQQMTVNRWHRAQRDGQNPPSRCP